MADKQPLAQNRQRPAWRDLADAIAKLAAAGAIVWGAYIANTFQSKSAAVSLLSEREQAETELRASMFRDLIQPIAGSDVSKIDASREQLLAQLLALNFHEHFEFKPLLLRVDERLKQEFQGEQLEEHLGQLRGMMRRIISRQVNMLISADAVDGNAEGVVSRIRLAEQPMATESCDFRSQICALREQVVTVSPDQRYELHLFVSEPDFAEESVRVNATLFPTNEPADEFEPYSVDFRLTWYDLPFTDHTLLADGTRFAFFLDFISKSHEPPVTIGLVWFPKDYFTPRERPINFSDFRDQLGLTPED